jgi:hypothetical protein
MAQNFAALCFPNLLPNLVARPFAAPNWPIGQAPAAQGQCGPDATDYVIQDIADFVAYMLYLRMFVGPSVPFGWPDQILYLFNFKRLVAFQASWKWMDFTGTLPPFGLLPPGGFVASGPDCVKTVRVFGECIRQNQIGNILFGLAAAFAPPSVTGSTFVNPAVNTALDLPTQLGVATYNAGNLANYTATLGVTLPFWTVLTPPPPPPILVVPPPQLATVAINTTRDVWAYAFNNGFASYGPSPNAALPNWPAGWNRSDARAAYAVGDFLKRYLTVAGIKADMFPKSNNINANFNNAASVIPALVAQGGPVEQGLRDALDRTLQGQANWWPAFNAYTDVAPAIPANLLPLTIENFLYLEGGRSSENCAVNPGPSIPTTTMSSVGYYNSVMYPDWLRYQAAIPVAQRSPARPARVCNDQLLYYQDSYPPGNNPAPTTCRNQMLLAAGADPSIPFP